MEIHGCDGPIGDSPHTAPTGADTAPGARERPGAGTNRMSLTAVTQRPGSGTAKPGTEEKPASRRREARDQEEEESGVIGER
ncbi:hypothetical protein NDU88_002974 [Pleurodeles waltl]|uniref:Uncharacterized protein n=1 Tax=Pleurodeles waltl TaxID=8319 RepID=A0AAV7TPU5_PLEWA|nr:hypothetical protein NDU88_002974 [Pleurodeles waltl]